MMVLITYDVDTISGTGQKRLRKVAKVCQDYGQRVQNSVFECRLTESQFVLLKNKIEKQIAVCEIKLQGYTENPMTEEDRKALNLFERFIDAKEYTNEMLKALIKNIYVYDDKRIKIEWNFTERLVENDICKEKEESA